jgi:hypothetical protein
MDNNFDDYPHQGVDRGTAGNPLSEIGQQNLDIKEEA